MKPWTKGQKILIIDIETTGFSHSKESIVEIGIVELDLISSTANVIYNSLCREDNFGEHNRDAWIFQNSNLKFEDVMNGENYTDPENGYAKYLNVESFVDHFIWNELSKNVDAYR